MQWVSSLLRKKSTTVHISFVRCELSIIQWHLYILTKTVCKLGNLHEVQLFKKFIAIQSHLFLNKEQNMNSIDPGIISFVNINLSLAHRSWVILAALFQCTWASRCFRLYRNNWRKATFRWCKAQKSLVGGDAQCISPELSNETGSAGPSHSLRIYPRSQKVGWDWLGADFHAATAGQFSIPQLPGYDCTNCGLPCKHTLKTTTSRGPIWLLGTRGRMASQQKHKKELLAAFTITLY